MDNHNYKKIEIPRCPKCKKGWYMLVIYDDDCNIKYVCPVCDYEINPDK